MHIGVFVMNRGSAGVGTVEWLSLETRRLEPHDFVGLTEHEEVSGARAPTHRGLHPRSSLTLAVGNCAHMLDVRMQIRVRRLRFAGWSIVAAEGSMCFPNSSRRPQVARLAVPPFAWLSPAANLKCPATRCLPEQVGELSNRVMGQRETGASGRPDVLPLGPEQTCHRCVSSGERTRAPSARGYVGQQP